MPQTINSAGTHHSSSGTQFESSVGGLVIQSVTTGNFMYTPDFLQPYAGTATSVPVISNVQLNSGAGIDNGGTSFAAGNAMLEFTVGEPVSITLTKTSMVTQGILQPFTSSTALPVLWMDFTAKRISANQVLLKWKTAQEINNKGFGIERKQENETSFANIGLEKTKAPYGNSSLPLTYQWTDNNPFTGKTLYRLKQEDIDGQYNYSVVRMVDGTGRTTISLKAWPVPAVGNFHVLVEGTEKDVLQVFDMNGKIVQQFNIQPGVPLTINNLLPGTYIVRLARQKDVVQKIILQ